MALEKWMELVSIMYRLIYSFKFQELFNQLQVTV